MREVLTKLGELDAKLDATLAAVIEQRDALKDHARQDHDDFIRVNDRVTKVERKQSWFIGAWTVVVALVAGSVAFIKDVLTP
jgi:hypothetical protein